MTYVDYRMDGDTLVLIPGERLTSENADAAEQEINTVRAENPAEQTVLDAGKLKYISSAGLRVLLRIRKTVPDFTVINAGTEVYDILEMTGFTEMMTVVKAFREMSVEGCDIIGKGAKGTVYRYSPDTIIKVFNAPDCLENINRERELARKAFVLGIPTAIAFDTVKVDGKFGSVFELLDAYSFSQLLAAHPENKSEYIRQFAEMLRLIHGTSVKTTDMPDAKRTAFIWVANDRPYLPAEDADRLEQMIRELPDRLTMIHGDYHTNNIMMQNGEALLIDMDTLSHGHPIFDLTNVYFTYEGALETDPKNTEKFLGIPAETCIGFWDEFLRIYLDTEDPEKLDGTTRKIRLMSYARQLQHIARRRGDTPEGKRSIELCADRIHELLAETDTLNF